MEKLWKFIDIQSGTVYKALGCLLYTSFDCILSMPENQMTFLLKMVLRIWQPFEGLCRARGRGRCQNGNDLCGSGDYWMLQLAASVCSLDIWAKIPFSSISVSGEPFSATWPFFNTMIWSAPVSYTHLKMEPAAGKLQTGGTDQPGNRGSGPSFTGNVKRTGRDHKGVKRTS